mmetsp:Transcript_94434/g.281871  ORF Transcript_94434/g.281871 Transcript_94434/m.281871 type:complete len:814 (+) Transcript_94434:43-2484(+)
MRQDLARCVASKDKAYQAVIEETYSALKVDFGERFTSLKPDIIVSGGEGGAVEHVSVLGLPRLGGSAHASVGNGQIHVAGVVGARVPFDAATPLAKPAALVCGGIHAQTYRCCQIIEQVLNVCHAQWADLIRLTVHMPELGESALEAFEQAADHFFQERGCSSVALSVVGCAQLVMSAAVQIEGTAVHRAASLSPERCPAAPAPEDPGPAVPAVARPWSRGRHGTSANTVASSSGICGRWRSQGSSADRKVPPAPDSCVSPADTPGSSVAVQPHIEPGRPVLAVQPHIEPGQPGRPRATERHQRSRPPLRSHRGPSEPAVQRTPPKTSAAECSWDDGVAEESLSLAGRDAVRGRCSSPALRWLGAQAPPAAPDRGEAQACGSGSRSADLEPRTESPALRWLLQQEQDEANADESVHATPRSSQAASVGGLPPAEETLLLSPSEMDELSRQFGLTGFTQETDNGEVAVPRRTRRTWVQRQRGEVSLTSSLEPVSYTALPCHWSRSEMAGNSYTRESSPLVVGHEDSLSLKEVPIDQARQIGLHFQDDHNMLWRVQTNATDTRRTVRLDPGDLLCKHLQGCKRVWSYTFDLVLARTSSSFVNVGLVEWVAEEMEEPSVESLPGKARGSEVPLTDLLGVQASEAQTTNLAWQHSLESPRQMMLACRKGVKWYGDSSEPVFNDDFIDQSMLHFRCDYTFSPEGVPIQVRLWLLPSAVVFRRQGRQVVRLDEPLFQCPLPSSNTPSERPGTRSLWVPAVTLFSQQDTVLFAWRGVARGYGEAASPVVRRHRGGGRSTPRTATRDEPSGRRRSLRHHAI